VIEMSTVDQQIINTQLRGKIEIVDAKFNQFMEEMRSRDDKRAAEITRIETKIDSMTSHIQILAVTAVGGIIAAGIGVAAMVINALTKG